MAVPAIQAAKHLAKLSHWKYTHLEIQKLLYLAHMFHLVKENEKPLVHGYFEAWEWGPVHPELYYELRLAGGKPILKSYPAWKNEKSIDSENIDVKWLNYISKCFPPGDGYRLLDITHNEQSAWKQLYKPMMNNRISEEDIIKEYNDQVNAAKRR
ncbi:MAG: DUF4065 domain-containing protein [Gammaproteobacteria bacterium]|nr:DUF4065 domain-containing protein [Gammaproteobacteria bacterium]